MSWNTQLGFDKDLLIKVDPKQSERQSYIMSMLVVMLMVLSLICFSSTLIYTLTIFQNWFIAVAVSLFLALVVFNIYRLFIMTTFDVSGNKLGYYYSNHEKHYAEHIEIGSDLSSLSDAQIQELSAVSKAKLREKSEMNFGSNTSNLTNVLTISIRVVIITIIALVFATGIELYIFKNQINTILEALKNHYISNGDTWMIENLFTAKKSKDFIIFNTNSLLLVIDLLNRGLGHWKIVIDLIFLTLFLVPLILVFKSKEIRQGEYLRELALSEITISFFHYLHAQRLSQNIISEIKKSKIIFSKSKPNI